MERGRLEVNTPCPVPAKVLPLAVETLHLTWCSECPDQENLFHCSMFTPSAQTRVSPAGTSVKREPRAIVAKKHLEVYWDLQTVKHSQGVSRQLI